MNDTVGGGEGGGPIPPDNSATVQPPAGCTLDQYASATGLPVDFLHELGLTQISWMGLPAVRIPYFDAEKVDVAIHFRVALNGDRQLAWKKNSKPLLYGLWRLGSPKYVVLTWAEDDAQKLWYQGFPALGVPDAIAWNEERDAVYLDSIQRVYVILSSGDRSHSVLEWIGKSRIRDRVHLAWLSADDVAVLHTATGADFSEKLQQVLHTAEAWTAFAARQAEANKNALWERCQGIATVPDVLELVVTAVRSCGVVGEDRAVKLLYLAVTSRLLDPPVSIAVKGPSSAGKSHTVEAVLRFFPSSAYYALSAMSERALVYSNEPLKHRFLVLYEATGLGSDFASYLLRSLLSEGRLAYETVEKTKNGELRPRQIVREGPTGLLVTTTETSLHPENETRFFSVPVNDTKEQTRAVMRALAADSQQLPDMAPWLALQEWLTYAEHRVVIPYAPALADVIPTVAVRLRRDFSAILALIEAHAILHQATRQRDAQWRIIANLADYAAVRELVADLVAQGVEATVPATIRETVEVVRAGSGSAVSVTQVAKQLNLDKSSASRRVKGAIEAGYLKNLETKMGHPAQLVLGDPLPADVTVLPPVEQLQGCTVAGETEGNTHPPSRPRSNLQ